MIRYQFDTPAAAAEALSAVLSRARDSEDQFRFGGLSLDELMSSGLWVDGDTSALEPILERVDGAVRVQ